MGAQSTCLESIQDRLESLYELRVSERVDDYLVTDGQILSDLGMDQGRHRERLLVQEQDEDILMSLYLDSEVFQQVQRCLASDAACAFKPREFCLAAEGVSHFVYLCWNAQFARQVTQLEMELQAEVDKYLLLAEWVGEEATLELHRWLFDSHEFEMDLDSEQLDRYVYANHYAGKYCQGLEARYLATGRHADMLNELRRFYRKTQGEKLRMIESLH